MNEKTYKCFYLFFIFFISNVITLAAETLAHGHIIHNHMQDDTATISKCKKEKILDVYQMGVIKGDNIPDKCIFSKFAEAWGLKYKKDSLYAILSVTNIHNELVSIRFNNPPYKHYYGDLTQLMELTPGETICFFIEIDNSSSVANLLTYHGDMSIPLDMNAPLVDWGTILSPSSENVNLTINQQHDMPYITPSSDDVILQISLFSRCKFPLYFPPPGTNKDDFYNISIITGEENANSSNMFCMMYFDLRSIEDGFLLLPGEHIISSKTCIYKKRNNGVIQYDLKNKILNKPIRAMWINGIYSMPIFVN